MHARSDLKRSQLNVYSFFFFIPGPYRGEREESFHSVGNLEDKAQSLFRRLLVHVAWCYLNTCPFSSSLVILHTKTGIYITLSSVRPSGRRLNTTVP